jgi:hypothetical protein
MWRNMKIEDITPTYNLNVVVTFSNPSNVLDLANKMKENGDLHASYNIIRKAVHEAIADGIEGIGVYSRSLSLLEFTWIITSDGMDVNRVNRNRNLTI